MNDLNAEIENAYDRFRDGELSLDGLGAVLLEAGRSPADVRTTLSEEVKYPLPVGYFGKE